MLSLWFRQLKLKSPGHAKSTLVSVPLVTVEMGLGSVLFANYPFAAEDKGK